MATTRIRLERKVQNTMTTQIETGEREVVLLENAHIRPMMGLDVLEPLPSRTSCTRGLTPSSSFTIP